MSVIAKLDDAKLIIRQTLVQAGRSDFLRLMHSGFDDVYRLHADDFVDAVRSGDQAALLTKLKSANNLSDDAKALVNHPEFAGRLGALTAKNSFPRSVVEAIDNKKFDDVARLADDLARDGTLISKNLAESARNLAKSAKESAAADDTLATAANKGRSWVRRHPKTSTAVAAAVTGTGAVLAADSLLNDGDIRRGVTNTFGITSRPGPQQQNIHNLLAENKEKILQLAQQAGVFGNDPDLRSIKRMLDNSRPDQYRELKNLYQGRENLLGPLMAWARDIDSPPAGTDPDLVPQWRDSLSLGIAAYQTLINPPANPQNAAAQNGQSGTAAAAAGTGAATPAAGANPAIPALPTTETDAAAGAAANPPGTMLSRGIQRAGQAVRSTVNEFDPDDAADAAGRVGTTIVRGVFGEKGESKTADTMIDLGSAAAGGVKEGAGFLKRTFNAMKKSEAGQLALSGGAFLGGMFIGKLINSLLEKIPVVSFLLKIPGAKLIMPLIAGIITARIVGENLEKGASAGVGQGAGRQFTPMVNPDNPILRRQSHSGGVPQTVLATGGPVSGAPITGGQGTHIHVNPALLQNDIWQTTSSGRFRPSGFALPYSNWQQDLLDHNGATRDRLLHPYAPPSAPVLGIP